MEGSKDDAGGKTLGILPITAVRHLTPFLGSRLGFLCPLCQDEAAGGPRLHLVTGEHPGRGGDVILLLSVALLLDVVHLRNMLGDIRGVHSGDILR